MEQGNSGRKYQFWGGIVISILCLIAIFVFIKPADIIQTLKNVRVGYLVLVGVSLVIFMLLRAIRWRFMLTGGWEGDSKVAYKSVFHIQNIGYMLNNFLPFRLGDVARAVLIGSVPPITISQGLSTMVVERVFDLLFIGSKGICGEAVKRIVDRHNYAC